MTLKNRIRCECGFSLIELMVILALIVIVVAIALPNFIKSRQGVNQSLAKARLAEVALAQSAFRSTLRNNRYGKLSELAGTRPNGVPLLALSIDADGSAPVQEGWLIREIEDATGAAFGVAIIGPSIGQGGAGAGCHPTYCVFEDAVVRGGDCDCNRNSPPIE